MTSLQSKSFQFPRQAIILAAGLGTRLRPLTHRIPKPALPVGGVPILFYNLYLLKEAGVKNVTVNLYHRPDEFKKILSGFRGFGIHLHFSFEKKILGTAGGIAQALDKMEKETTFVLNGDIICDLDLKKMYGLHRRTHALATLACVPRDRARVSSFVEFDPEGRILRIAGSPNIKRVNSLTKAIFSGAHLLEPDLFQNYPRDKFGCVIRQVYQPALKDGGRLQAYGHQGEWWDLGNLQELKRVDQSLWQRKVSPAMVRFWGEVYRWSRPLFHNA